MHRSAFIIIIRIIILDVIMLQTYSFRASLFIHPPVPGLPPNTDPTTRGTTIIPSPKPSGPLFLESYLAPVMQALAYYVELLQYEPREMTTLEPPLNSDEVEQGTTYTPPPKTTSKPGTASSTTTQKPWWQPATTTQKPTATTTTTWWKPPSTTTRKPSTIWWQPPSTTSFTTSTPPLSTLWWQTTTTSPPCITTTSRKPSTIWWMPPSTTKTTRRPSQTTQWWQASSTAWWQSTKPTSKPITTTTNNIPFTTPYHKPGLFAPHPPSTRTPILSTNIYNNAIDVSVEKESYNTGTAPSFITSDKNFLEWLLQPKAKILKPLETEYDFQLLDPLPASLIHDILNERYEFPALLDSDNVKEFLRVYDDSFARYRPLTGKKKVPPTKPYVEFLLLYDLLKREAKSMNLNKYEGYSPKMLRELAETSKRSADRQLHTLMTRMLARGDVRRSDVQARVKSIIKDLQNPASVTSQALRYIPPLQFAL